MCLESQSMDERLEIASRILAGFAANPAIFADNEQCGWSLVNCKDCELADYAWKLANELVIRADSASERTEG